MNGSGLFFLTSQPSLVVIQSPDDGTQRKAWQFQALERTKRGVQRLMALWDQPEAALFVQAHARHLRKGCALKLELERVRPAVDRDGLAAFVLSCSLAPVRWPDYHAEPDIDAPHQPRPLPA